MSLRLSRQHWDWVGDVYLRRAWGSRDPVLERFKERHMPVTFEVQLTDDEQEQLANIMQIGVTDLDAALTPYARAALQEYVRMFLGQKVFTRGSDIHEYRLSLLIREAFDNEIPDEQTVCNLFQTTATQSRSLIRSVMSKYQYDLHSAIERTLRAEIEGAEQEEEDGDWILTTNSENVVEALNRRLASIDGSLPQISKQRGSVSSYVIKPSSYQRLTTALAPAG